LALLDTLEWDFVFFGHEGTGGISRADRRTSENDFGFDVCKGEILTAHFYGINGRILPSLIAHLDRLITGPEGDREAGPMPLDGAFNIFRKNNGDVRTLIAHPKLGWQRPSRSDITPKAFDHFPLLRPAITMLRELKHLTSLWRS